MSGRRTINITAAICLWLTGGLAAQAADRWEDAGALAILPTPKPAKVIAGGLLSCEQQRWTFLFRLAPAAAIDANTITKAKLAADEFALELDASASTAGVDVRIPYEMLAALKSGGVLKVELLAGEAVLKTAFNLRNSKLVIDAVAPRCSQIDMSAYLEVSMSATDAAVPTATGLLKDEIKLFREFTMIQPTVATRVLELADNKRLMFAALCGSKNYFGDSGCSLTGYAADGADSIWRMVYETEGQLLYTDPAKVDDGWPNLVTLPVVGGSEPVHWTWSGEQYQLVDQAISQDEGVQEQGDTAAQ